MTTIRDCLYALADEKNAAFAAKLIPTVPPERILGARTPELRRLAKELKGTQEAERFLDTLPHELLEENHLHAFLLEQIRDYDACMAQLERFLPYIDNWATCDSLSPKVLKKHRPELREKIRNWLQSDRPYTVRFGVKMLMDHFLDRDFDPGDPELVAQLHWDHYYVNMVRAWYFATALARQYEAALPFLENDRLDLWTHNKAIQKAIESYRVPEEHKQRLRQLKRKS